MYLKEPTLLEKETSGGTLFGTWNGAESTQFGPLQLAYLGDTLQDLFVRAKLLMRGQKVGEMHKEAVRFVNAKAQARMLEVLSPEFTQEEADVVRRGRNAQAKHHAPKGTSPADYTHATALETLWGYLFVTNRQERLTELMEKAVMEMEETWQEQTSR